MDAATQPPTDGGAAPDGAPADASGARDAEAPGSSYNPCPPAGKACVLLPLGDSLTQGANSTDNGGYRTELFSQAVMHGQSFTTVGSRSSGPTAVAGMTFPRRHEGHGGFTTAQISDWITTNATITTYKPDVVLLHIGWNGLRPATADVAALLRDLGTLVDQILASDSHLLLIVAQVIPMWDDGGTKNVMVYNAGIPALVQTRQAAGKHIALANVYAAFAADPNWKTDYYPATGGHPNDAGYVAMGRGWYAAVAPLLH
jgi:lysophospholipase L1-like esterase